MEAAQLVEFQAADYPLRALLKGVEADVQLRLAISARGEVTAAYATADSVEYPFAALAKASILKAHFLPARVNGSPAASTLTLTYRFAIQKPPVESSLAFTQGAQVTGEILAGGTRTAVVGADVVAVGLGLTATTDAKGRFTLPLPPGEHVLVIAPAGFLPTKERVSVSAGSTVDVTFHPRRTEVGELEATVQGDRARAAPSHTAMVREELRNVPGSQSDPLRVVENLPGIARAPFTGGQLIVRGARPQDTGAYIDGQRIPILYHLLNGPSVLSEDMVDRIDFLPGGADAFYGRSLAGVVSIASRRGDPDRYHGLLAADLNKSSVFLQGPIGQNVQFAAGARRSYINPVVQLFTDANHELTLPVYWDYQARTDAQLANNDRLSLLFYGSNDSFQVVGGGEGSQPIANGLRIGFHRAKLTWEHKLSDAVSLTASPVIGFDLTDHSSQGSGAGAFAGGQSEMERTLSYGLRGEAQWKARPDLDLRLGIDTLFDRVRYALDQLYDAQLRSLGAPNAEESVRSGVRHFSSAGEYLEAEWRVGPLRLTPGLRLEQMHWTGHTFLLAEPRIWARVSLGRQTALHAYAGVYHEAPLAQQLDQVLGNPDLTPQRADQYGLGITQRIGDRFSVRAEGYLNRRSSLVFPATARARDDGTIDNPLQLNSGVGHSLGLEVLLRREISARWYGWISYSRSRSRELSAPGQTWLPTAYDQPHVFTMLAAFRPSTQVEFSGRLRVASGNPTAPVISSSFDADSGNYVPKRQPFGQDRLPTFVQLDFEINNIWSADLYRLSLYLDFQNVLNRRNSEILVYDYRFTQSDSIHGLPFLASIGAKVTF